MHAPLILLDFPVLTHCDVNIAVLPPSYLIITAYFAGSHSNTCFLLLRNLVHMHAYEIVASTCIFSVAVVNYICFKWNVGSF